MAVEHVAAAPIEELDSNLARAYQGVHLSMQDLHGVPLTVTAELGRVQMKVRDVLALKVGSLVILDKFAGQLADVSVNGLPMGRADIVVMGDSLHVRLAENGAGISAAGSAHA